MEKINRKKLGGEENVSQWEDSPRKIFGRGGGEVDMTGDGKR